MPRKKIINELKKLMKQRGNLTKVQREYAMAEEKAMMQMYPMTRPSEEKRFSHLRTLERYVGEQAAKMITERKTVLATVRQPVNLYDRRN